MREILFRGKRTDNHKWIEGTGVFNDGVNTWIFANEPNRAIAYGMQHYIVNLDTVGQYTGLTDKNGTKIFEGDIILFEDESPTNYEYHDCTEMRCGEIKFDDGEFSLTTRIAVELGALIYHGKLDGEIVGNIHDIQRHWNGLDIVTFEFDAVKYAELKKKYTESEGEE